MNTHHSIVPVILCGGSGSRLWPLSRKSLPKQFAPLVGDGNLFELTLQRISEGHFNKPLIVASEAHRFHVLKQAANLGMQCEVLLEPAGRNTAPAIIMAALHLKANGHDGHMLVLPSDHLIPDHIGFSEAINAGMTASQNSKLVTFGISPTGPETGYGYIQTENSSGAVLDVCAFHEKPAVAKAEQMLAEGGYFWNAGIFLVSVDRLLALAELHQPEMLAAVEDAIADMTRDDSFLRPDAEKWKLVPAESIDYAIIEKCDDIACVPFSGSWSDLGDWNSVFAVDGADKNGNRLRGGVTAVDCVNTNLWSTNDQTRLVGLGLDGIVAVATDDAIMVANASRTQDVREIVAVLDKAGVPQAHQHTKDYRPWGWFESLIVAPGYQVKRLHVDPRARLSLQSHQHRSEHWVVVAGTATVLINEREKQVNTNESVYINVGDKHRLANDTDQPLVVIEVQTGSYLGEDDIVRYHDDFSRGLGEL